MTFVESILCLVQGFLAELFNLLNTTLGALFGFELDPPDLGCIPE